MKIEPATRLRVDWFCPDDAIIGATKTRRILILVTAINAEQITVFSSFNFYIVEIVKFRESTKLIAHSV